jgi:hypothetical protein
MSRNGRRERTYSRFKLRLPKSWHILAPILKSTLTMKILARQSRNQKKSPSYISPVAGESREGAQRHW